MNYSRFITAVTDNKKISDRKFYTRILNNAANATPDCISFCAGMPSDKTYPFKKITVECTDGSTLVVEEDECLKLMPYQTAYGLPKLIASIKKIHRKYHSPPTMDSTDSNAWDAVVTQGAAGGVSLLFSVLLKKDDLVLVEDYGFGAVRSKIYLREADCAPIKTDELGMIPEDLIKVLDELKEKSINPRVLLINPNGQNPTGTICPMDRKQAIYKIAQDFDLMIVEDDPYHYLQYIPERVGSFQSIDVDGRVIRVDSVSKLIAPSIRIGWVSGPKAIIKHVVEAQIGHSMACSSISQVLVSKLLELWQLEGFETRINYLSNEYRIKRDITDKALQKHFKDIGEWQTPQAGLFFWIRLKNVSNSSFLVDIEESKKYKVFAVPGLEYNCKQSEVSSYIRICFTKVISSEVDEGIRRLSEFIKDHTNRIDSN